MHTIKKLGSNFINSVQGLKVLWGEHSFRVECYIFAPLTLLLFWLDFSTTERLIALVLMCLVLVVEGLNTAIEIVCNRITTEYDEGIKAAKDVASASVMLMNTALLFYVIFILI